MAKKGFLFSGETKFNNPSAGEMDTQGVSREVENFIREKKGDYQLIIGSDSRTKSYQGKPGLDLVTAVVIHRKGRGGRYFWARKRIARFYPLKEKIYQETLASLELADKFIPLLKNCLNGEFERLEIHIDVGGNGPTKVMIKELVGMVVGNGFVAKTKPESFGASVVADRYT